MTARLLALVAALVVASAFQVSTAGAAQPPEPEALPSSALDLTLELRRVDDRLEAVRRSTTRAEQDVLATRATLNVTIGLMQVNEAERATVEARVRERGVAAYTQQGDVVAIPLDVDRAADLAAARLYTRASSAVDTEALAALGKRYDRLEDELAAKDAARVEAAGDLDHLVAEHALLEQRRSEVLDLLNALGAVPVMGPAMLTSAQLANWYRSTGAVPKLAPGVTIDDVAQLYIEEGAAENVRGDLAFAQSIIETGSFGVAAGNNYSGIGVCDSCTGGYSFVDPREGVRAQIQLLRNYADPSSRASNLAHPPAPSLYGDDQQKAQRLYDTFFLKGKAPLWNLMGNGNWATDPLYSGKVIDLFSRMVAWAAAASPAEIPS